MKRIVATALIVFIMLCTFTACKNSDNVNTDSDIKVIDFDTTRPTEKPTEIKPNKNIKIRVPSYLIESEAGGDVKKYAATYGYEIKEDKDGNMTMKMDGRTYSLLLSGIGLRVMIALGEIVDSGDYPYIVRLGDYNQDYSYILMLVNSQKYNKSKNAPSYEELSEIIGLHGLYYQGFTTEEENKCEVIFADHKSGEIVHREVYTN